MLTNLIQKIFYTNKFVNLIKKKLIPLTLPLKLLKQSLLILKFPPISVILYNSYISINKI